MTDLEYLGHLNKLVEEGRKAQCLLENEVFRELIASLKQQYSDQTFSTPDREQRDVLYHQHLALQALEEVLAYRVALGENAQNEIDLNP